MGGASSNNNNINNNTKIRRKVKRGKEMNYPHKNLRYQAQKSKISFNLWKKINRGI